MAVYIFLNYSPVASKLVEVSEANYSAQVEGKEYVRITAYRFYMTEVSPSTFTALFGNGQYSAGKSGYADFIDRYGRSEGLFPADVGYASIYLFFGAAGVLIFFLLLLRVSSIKLQEQYRYARYYIYFLFLGNIAGSTLLGSIPILCIALYIISKNKKISKPSALY